MTWIQCTLRYWVGDTGSVALLYQETGWAAMVARLGILVTCIILVGGLALSPKTLAQVSQRQPGTDIVVQQALTQQQVLDNSKDLTRLQSDVDNERQALSTMRDDLSTVKGIGIGAAAVIGLLQALQMVLQVRAVKQKTT